MGNTPPQSPRGDGVFGGMIYSKQTESTASSPPRYNQYDQQYQHYQQQRYGQDRANYMQRPQGAGYVQSSNYYQGNHPSAGSSAYPGGTPSRLQQNPGFQSSSAHRGNLPQTSSGFSQRGYPSQGQQGFHPIPPYSERPGSHAYYGKATGSDYEPTSSQGVDTHLPVRSMIFDTSPFCNKTGKNVSSTTISTQVHPNFSYSSSSALPDSGEEHVQKIDVQANPGPAGTLSGGMRAASAQRLPRPDEVPWSPPSHPTPYGSVIATPYTNAAATPYANTNTVNDTPHGATHFTPYTNPTATPPRYHEQNAEDNSDKYKELYLSECEKVKAAQSKLEMIRSKVDELTKKEKLQSQEHMESMQAISDSNMEMIKKYDDIIQKLNSQRHDKTLELIQIKQRRFSLKENQIKEWKEKAEAKSEGQQYEPELASYRREIEDLQKKIDSRNGELQDLQETARAEMEVLIEQYEQLAGPEGTGTENRREENAKDGFNAAHSPPVGATNGPINTFASPSAGYVGNSPPGQYGNPRGIAHHARNSPLSPVATSDYMGKSAPSSINSLPANNTGGSVGGTYSLLPGNANGVGLTSYSSYNNMSNSNNSMLGGLGNTIGSRGLNTNNIVSLASPGYSDNKGSLYSPTDKSMQVSTPHSGSPLQGKRPPTATRISLPRS